MCWPSGVACQRFCPPDQVVASRTGQDEAEVGLRTRRGSHEVVELSEEGSAGWDCAGREREFAHYGGEFVACDVVSLQNAGNSAQEIDFLLQWQPHLKGHGT